MPLVLRAVRHGGDAAVSATAAVSARIYWQGAATNILNPKVAVFYVAFLPQFVSAELGSAPLQLLVLGLTHWVIGVPYLGMVALASGAVAARLRRSPHLRRALDVITGVVFVGLAVRLLAVERKAA